MSDMNEVIYVASLWRDAGRGVCVAPANYRGDCARLLDTNAMNGKDKLEFAMRCSARWLLHDKKTQGSGATHAGGLVSLRRLTCTQILAQKAGALR